MKKTMMLMILDGFGYSLNTQGNAIAAANLPGIDNIFSKYPHTTLGASGPDVGLPVGQMGNSEVGHLNIGSGRIVYQELTRISKAIEDETFFNNPALNSAMENVKKNNSSLHLLGLLSDGGVHSHITHLFALLDLAKRNNIENVFIHAFLDGRDVSPKSAEEYIAQLEAYIALNGVGRIASISGRYYAMDRDNRFERVQIAYDALTSGLGEKAPNPLSAVENAYLAGQTDEFVLPTIITDQNEPISLISDNDSVIMFNFRPDRAREITRCFTDSNFSGFKRSKVLDKLFYVCMTQYDAKMPSVSIAFSPQSLANTLGEFLSKNGYRQLRIAETEKYAHVTFFFNGGVEAPNENEDRVLIQSPKVATYDLKPEMSAFEVTDAVLKAIDEDCYDVIILNFANPDMVGHTGNFPATVKALEALDKCIIKIFTAMNTHGGQILLTADHGNCDAMVDPDGCVVTCHSTNRVPFLVMTDDKITLRDNGILADIAPTMLHLMGLTQPVEMTGKSLVL